MTLRDSMQSKFIRKAIGRTGRAGVCIAAAALSMLLPGRGVTDSPMVEEDGTVRVAAFLLPESSFLSEESRVLLLNARKTGDAVAAARKACPSIEEANRVDVPAIRTCQAQAFYETLLYKRLRAHYDVALSSKEIGGVHTEIFTPTGGVAANNRNRVLVNLHGGGFHSGSRTIGHLESMPIASLGRIRVLSIDYRMAPEYAFPAASVDVGHVYRELLKTYKPQNIGFYGCSAGGVLTAQAIAWLDKEGLPLPGAVGMFCGAGSYWAEGDSGHWDAALRGRLLKTPNEELYFKNADPADPLLFPVQSTQLMAKFPPSLLISSTRDLALSSVVHTHSVLVRQGVAADLHVWEGLGHAFFFDPDLPQSLEVHEITTRFFDRYLGR